MEPAFYRGDLLFLTNPANTRYETGDITVYKIPGQDVPIVHRVLVTRDVAERVNGYERNSFLFAELQFAAMCSSWEKSPRPENQLLLTKGDNNPMDDIDLYQGLSHIERKHVVGKVRGCAFFSSTGYAGVWCLSVGIGSCPTSDT